jgi:hypothetical protein
MEAITLYQLIALCTACSLTGMLIGFMAATIAFKRAVKKGIKYDW